MYLSISFWNATIPFSPFHQLLRSYSGGTSAGTPQWAALLAIANQGRVLDGESPLANAQAALYAMPHSDFHDIVSGSNGFSAAPGYDLASGLGSPIANLLIDDLVEFHGSTDFTVAAGTHTVLVQATS